MATLKRLALNATIKDRQFSSTRVVHKKPITGLKLQANIVLK